MYLLSLLKCVENVVRQTWQKVNDEPAAQVVVPNDLCTRDDLTGRRVHKGRVEVQYDVDEEDDVDCTVKDKQGHVVEALVAEGGVEGNHDGSVEGQQKDQPVPDATEQGVVENDVRWGARRILLVARKNIEVYGEHLEHASITRWSNRIVSDWT